MPAALLEKHAARETASAPRATAVFYGASRFESPSVGMVFRRGEHMFQVTRVSATHDIDAEFGRSWKFVADCRTLR